MGAAAPARTRERRVVTIFTTDGKYIFPSREHAQERASGEGARDGVREGVSEGVREGVREGSGGC